jgi:hypothetical protein
MHDRNAERPSSRLPSQQHLHGFTEQGLAEFDIAARPRLHCLAKTSRQGHRLCTFFDPDWMVHMT